MIDLNVNERKSLQFDVSVSGVQMNDLLGSMKIVMEDIQYCFPIKILDGKIVVDIPPLSKFIKEEFLKEQSIDAKLEIIAGDTYLVPWEDQLLLKSPIKVEAIMSDAKDVMEKITPKIEVKPSPKVIVEEKPVKESRMVIDITTDDEMKIAKLIGKKYYKQLTGYSPMKDEVIFDGDKKLLDKIKQEFKSSLPKKKKSKFAEVLEK